MQNGEQPNSHRSSGWSLVSEAYDNVASTRRRRSADDALSRMLPQLSHLDLTGLVSHEDRSMRANGGYCDVFVGTVATKHLQRHCTTSAGSDTANVAIKRLRVRLGQDKNFAKSLARELGIWSSLEHPNILPFLGYLLENEYPSLVSEWIENGTVREYLQSHAECNITHLAHGIAEGLEYLHNRDIVHSDLKADNVLISQSGEPLICDFGISRMLDSSQTFFVSTTHEGLIKGSTRWMAIELHMPDSGVDPKHTKETDVWAYGMTLYEMISKRVPYAHFRNDAQVLLAIVRGELPTRPTFVDAQSSLSPLWPICTSCWEHDIKTRCIVAQIVQELAIQLGLEQLMQQQTEIVPCQAGPTVFGWSSSNEQGNWIPNGLNDPPLSRETFLVMLQDWWRRNGIKSDGRMTVIDNRQIDIHQLYTEVLQYGGVVNVRRHDLWNVIAAKMGWTPASIYEAGRTQDQIAEQFKVVYEQLLESFEVICMPAMMKQSLTAQSQYTADQQGGPSQPSAGSNQPSTMNSVPRAGSSDTLTAPSLVDPHFKYYFDHILPMQYALVSQRRGAMNEQLLESSETTYMTTAMKESLTAQPQQTADQQGGPSQPSAGPSGPGGPNQQLSTQQAVHMMKLANMSAEQMRAAVYPEYLIQNVEQNRPAPQATWRRMQMQRIQAQQQQQQQEQGAGLNPPFPIHVQHQAQTALHNSSLLQTQGSIPNANALSHPGFSAQASQSNDMPAQQGSQLNAQNLTPQDMQMLNVLWNLQKPNPESIKRALSVIDQMKQDISKERSFRPEHVKHLSDAEKGAFPGQFEALCNVIEDVFKLLHMYLASTNDVNIVRGLLNIYDMCDKQRQLVQSANPIYVLDVATLQRLMKTAVELKSKVLLVMQQLRIMSQADTQNQARAAMQQQIDGGLPPPPAAQQGLSPQNLASSPASVPPRPPITQPQPPQIPQQNLRVLPTRTPQMAPARPTPLPASAMPSHLQTSPRTLKSPRPKAQPKPRPRQRRTSKVVPPNANAAVVSTSNSITEPAPSPVQATPSPAESSFKRPREEDASAQSGSTSPPGSENEDTPSKRIKNDWQNMPDAEPPKRQVEAKFYSDMSKILELSHNSALPPDLQETPAQLMKSAGLALDILDAAGSSMSNLTSAGSSSPKATDGDDSFLGFLDSTVFQQEENKADLDSPYLVPTPLTNSGPESGLGG